MPLKIKTYQHTCEDKTRGRASNKIIATWLANPFNDEEPNIFRWEWHAEQFDYIGLSKVTITFRDILYCPLCGEQLPKDMESLEQRNKYE